MLRINKLRVILVILAIALAVLPVHLHADEALDARLSRGEIIITSRAIAGSDLPEVTVQAVVDTSPAKMWKIIDDCTHYKQNMQRVANSKELSRKGNVVVCEVEIELPFPLSNLTGVTEATHVVGPPTWSRTWKLIRGDYEKNTGSWTLSAFDAEGKRTRATYKIHVIPKSNVPNALLRKAQRESLPKLIEHLREITKGR